MLNIDHHLSLIGAGDPSDHQKHRRKCRDDIQTSFHGFTFSRQAGSPPSNLAIN
jgi:hypothetical protein